MGAEQGRGRSGDPRRRFLRAPARAGEYLDLAFQFGIATMAGAFGGYWLDGRVGSRPVLTLVGTLAGAAAGFYSLYRGLMSMGRPKDADHGE